MFKLTLFAHEMFDSVTDNSCEKPEKSHWPRDEVFSPCQSKMTSREPMLRLSDADVKKGRNLEASATKLMASVRGNTRHSPLQKK
jgi:hypothetical protein